jgi:hypothetical protein
MQEHQIPFNSTKYAEYCAQLISIFTLSPCLTTTSCLYIDFLTGLGSEDLIQFFERPPIVLTTVAHVASHCRKWKIKKMV